MQSIHAQVVVEANAKGSRLIEAWQMPSSSSGGAKRKLDLPSDGSSHDHSDTLGKTLLIIGVAALVTGAIILAVTSASSSGSKKTK